MATQVKELGLGDYVDLLKRRWRWLVGSLVIGIALVAAVTFTRDEVYQSRADILVLTETSTGQFSFEPAVEERLQRASIAELQLAVGRKYLVTASEVLGYEPAVEIGLLPSADPSKPALSSVLRVDSFESSPIAAQDSAQTFAESYVLERSEEDLDDLQSAVEITNGQLDDLRVRRLELEQPITDLRTQRNQTADPAEIQRLSAEIDDAVASTRSALTSINEQVGTLNADLIELEQTVEVLVNGDSATRIINPAYLPVDPVSPDIPRNLLIGALVAFIMGLLLATLRELLDSGAGDASELATLADTPIIAAVPRLQKNRRAPGGVTPFASLPAEQASPYRVLLDSVWLSGNGEAVRTVAITAVRSGLGSTQTAVNMAQAEARRGVAVCLVDADFSAPAVLQRLGRSEDGPGLADLLADRCALDEAFRATDVPELHVIGAGKVDRSTPDHLRSRRLEDLLRELGALYELVVVDTSPISGLVDSRIVASQCDGVVVVYDQASSKRDEVVTAVDLVRSARARPIGLVSNRSSVRQQIHLVEASA